MLCGGVTLPNLLVCVNSFPFRFERKKKNENEHKERIKTKNFV